MTVSVNASSQIGIKLAARLGINLPKREGHDLAGPCIACQSSDAFRLHMQTGVGHCFSCGGKWSPFQVAEAVTKDREQAKAVLVELGVFQPANVAVTPTVPNPLIAIAAQKGVTPESFTAFGARFHTIDSIRFPCYGPDGQPCTTFTISKKPGTQASKGLFAKGNPAGLFFPHVAGKVRLPQEGEIWHLVEGPKDAAALHGLELLACGMNTCRLAAKFARLFAGVDIVLVPDRDRAGEEGALFSARVLRGIAKSVRIAVLPAESKESGGEDVRDILRRQGGRELVLQAITDARPPDGWDAPSEEAKVEAPKVATIEIALSEGESIKLEVARAGREPQRMVVAVRGELSHRDRINTDSSTSRDRFVKKLSEKFGIDRAVLAPLVEPHLTALADQIDGQGQLAGGFDDEDEQSQATIAANIALQWDLWHTPGKEAFATIPVGEHSESWAIRSQTFKRYLAKQFFDEEGKAMNSDAISAAVNLIEAQALFEGEEHTVHVRVAEHEGHVYLDLCDPSWRVVEISPDGWQVVEESPVRFRRSRGMLPLPSPEQGGDINLLRRFLNVDDNTWCLVVAWLVASLRPRGPYPLLALFAEQGSGKSTTGRILRELVDPNAAPLRAEPSDARDLMIGANNSWCLAYDNLSHVPPWLSDALCRLSTGGGFATRELYTDQDEVIFDSQRPVMLTSIEEVASRSDLLDRCLVVWLPAIPEDQRRPEATLIADFVAARPKILGALLDAVAVALKRLPTIHLASLPRMADFAVWASAAETGLGWSPGTFLRAYSENRESANEVALEASLIARPLLELLEDRQEWTGTASELLEALESRVTDQVKRQNSWPKNARSMSGHLKRLAPNLRAGGWELKSSRGSKQRSITIQRIASPASSSWHVSNVASSIESGGSLQFDASRCNAFRNDGRDADDAISGEATVGGFQSQGNWEEGEL